MDDIILPTFGITDDTAPSARRGSGEDSIVFRRIDRFQTEYFNMGAGFTLEMHPCRDNLRIIEYHYGILRKKVREFLEGEMIDLAVDISEKF